MHSEAISVCCLGRPFQLGMLYDCRSDSLVAGPSLWDKDSIKEATSVRTKEYSSFDLITSDSLNSKTTGIDANASIKLSFLAGMIDVSGSARFLNDYKKSKRNVRVTLHYTSTSRFEEFSAHTEAKYRTHPAYDHVKRMATHVVTGILYGADAYFVFDHETSHNEERTEIEGQLSASLNRLPVSVSGSIGGSYTHQEKSFTEKLKCTFYGDVVLDVLPTTYDQAVVAYKKLTQLIKIGGNSIPKTVWLLPLTVFDWTAPSFSMNITDDLSVRAQSVVEDLESVKQSAVDLLIFLSSLIQSNTNLKSILQYIQHQVELFLSLVSSKIVDFSSAMKLLLPQLRTGSGTGSDDFLQLVIKTTAQPFDKESLLEWLERKQNEARTLKELISLLDVKPAIKFEDVGTVKSVHKLGDLNNIILDGAGLNLVVLRVNIAKSDHYLEWMNDTEKEKSSSEQLHWFQQSLMVCTLSEKINCLAGFATSNSVSSTKCVIVYSDKNVTNNRDIATFKVYHMHGEEEEDFDIPSKPRRLSYTQTQNSVELTWKLPSLGANSITEYRLTYEYFRKKKTGFIRKTEETEYVREDKTFPNTAFSCIIPKLAKDTVYHFMIQAKCKIGWCEPSETLKVTLQ